MRVASIRYVIVAILLFKTFNSLYAQESTIQFVVSMEQPATHTFHVIMNCKGFQGDSMDVKMPVWSPGYYQRLDFAHNVENFEATDPLSNITGWRKMPGNAWRVSNRSGSFILSYDVKTIRPFVGTPYLDERRGYILPAGVFLYPAGEIHHPVTVTINLIQPGRMRQPASTLLRGNSLHMSPLTMTYFMTAQSLSVILKSFLNFL
jgi:predicted metalloprotease with PDZ domain